MLYANYTLIQFLNEKKQRKLYTNILYEHQCKTGQHNIPPQQNEVKKKPTWSSQFMQKEL